MRIQKNMNKEAGLWEQCCFLKQYFWSFRAHLMKLHLLIYHEGYCHVVTQDKQTLCNFCFVCLWSFLSLFAQKQGFVPYSFVQDPTSVSAANYLIWNPFVACTFYSFFKQVTQDKPEVLAAVSTYSFILWNKICAQSVHCLKSQLKSMVTVRRIWLFLGFFLVCL